MTWLIIVVLAVLVVALYPVVRDFIRQRRSTFPAYVEGLQLALDNRIPEAIARLKEAVRLDTNNVDAYIRLGDLFMQQGEIDRAIRIHENLALRRNLEPRDEKRIYQALVRDYLRTDRKVKATSILEELVHLDKADLSSREQLLKLYVETGSWEKCEALLKDITRTPQNRRQAARLYTEFGRAYGKVNAKVALGCFNTALRLDSSSVEARVYLGDHQLAEGDTEAAIRTWNELLNLAPEKNALVRERLERAYYEVGRYDDIIPLYEKLLRRMPDDAGLAVELAEIYAKKEDVESATRMLERLARTKAADPSAQVALASLYVDAGQPARARAVLADALNRLREAAASGS